MTGLSVYSIDAGLPFARELAAGVMKLAASPERLAGGLILLPSRRAARALQAAFLDVANGQPMLLPRMLPVGDFGLLRQRPYDHTRSPTDRGYIAIVDWDKTFNRSG